MDDPKSCNMSVTAVILAGGMSRRFGPANKLLARFDGRTLIETTILSALSTRAGNAVLIWPVDKPSIQPDSVNTLLDSGSENRILVPVYDGHRGHPVYFGQTYREELVGLEGDTGARPILDRHPEAVLEVEVDDPGVVFDVDTESDLQRFLATYSNTR